MKIMGYFTQYGSFLNQLHQIQINYDQQ